jgi:uncharacterized protein involved in exopolysaccharide biosynthesis
MLTTIRIILTATANTELPSDDRFSAGTIGGVFFLGMAVACVLLWRNMNGKLKNLDKKFDEKDK